MSEQQNLRLAATLFLEFITCLTRWRHNGVVVFGAALCLDPND
jgi:hypothetical protein